MLAGVSCVTFTCAVLVLVPLPWHIRARNVAIVSMGLWLFCMNVIYGTDLIVWAGNVRDSIPVWCDITTGITTGFNIAIPAACLCICIHLERIASLNQSSTRSAKSHRIIFQALMCGALPIVYVALHYIVQGHRYDIFENFGCRPTTYVSLPVVFLMWIPPLALTLATIFFAGLALRHFLFLRIRSPRKCDETSSLLTTGRYMRLIAMSTLEMVWVTVFLCVNIRYSLIFSSGLRPWTGLANVHSDFGHVGTFSSANLPKDEHDFLTFMWWTVPVSSIFFFGFFALGEEAISEYRSYWVWLRHRIPRTRRGRMMSLSKAGFLPANTEVTSPWSPYSPGNRMQGDLQSLPPALLAEHDADDVSFISATPSFLGKVPSGIDPHHVSITSIRWPACEL